MRTSACSMAWGSSVRGDAGAWRPERDDDEFEGGFVRRFASEVSIGDVFLLRTGIARICAVGLVASTYHYLHQFDDVNGLDLQHARRIRWCKLPQEYDFGSPIFGASPGRFSRIRNEHIMDYVERFRGRHASCRLPTPISCASKNGRRHCFAD